MLRRTIDGLGQLLKDVLLLNPDGKFGTELIAQACLKQMLSREIDQTWLKDRHLGQCKKLQKGHDMQRCLSRSTNM